MENEVSPWNLIPFVDVLRFRFSLLFMKFELPIDANQHNCANGRFHAVNSKRSQSQSRCTIFANATSNAVQGEAYERPQSCDYVHLSSR